MARQWSKKKRPAKEDKQLVERNKISGKVFDEKTIDSLYKLLNEGTIKGLEYPIAQGKEAIVFKATSGKGNAIAVKIFKFETSSFKKEMIKYVDGDPRFYSGQKRHRALVLIWARKEYSNLKVAQEAGVLVPKTSKRWDNIVVMEFLGGDGMPSPLIKDAVIDNPTETYNMVIDFVRKLYVAHLVHADLNEFNIVYHNKLPYFIDWGQGVKLEHPKAIEFLRKDVENVVKFFHKQGVDCNFEDAFKFVTGQ